MVVEGGEVHGVRRLAIDVLGRAVFGTCFEQGLHHFEVPLESGIMQRLPSLRVPGSVVRAGTVAQQRLDYG